MDMFRQKKYLGIAGNGITIVGLFLPILNVSGANFISSFPGILILILSVLSLLIIFSDKLSANVPFFEKLKNQKLTLICTGISAVLLIVNIMNASAIMAFGRAFGVSYGIGVWAMGIGLVVSAIYPFLYKGE